MWQISHYCADEAATIVLAKQVAQTMSTPPCVIFLSGSLGAGKTTFVRSFLRQLGYQQVVKSPTFTLVEAYHLTNIEVYHFDLYRITDPAELDYVGFVDYFTEQSICFVEWPEKGTGVLPIADIEGAIDVLPSGRQFTWTANSPKGQQILQNLQDLLRT